CTFPQTARPRASQLRKPAHADILRDETCPVWRIADIACVQGPRTEDRCNPRPQCRPCDPLQDSNSALADPFQARETKSRQAGENCNRSIPDFEFPRSDQLRLLGSRKTFSQL